MKNKYIVILVDDREQADVINAEAHGTQYSTVKVEAFPAMSQMVGVRHRETRPTLIIDMITDRGYPAFERWYNAEVVRNAVKAEIIRMGDE